MGGAGGGATGWEVFYETVSREAIQRLSPAHHMEAVQAMPHHGERLPLWADTLLHPLRILGANLPWSAFALITLWPGFARLFDEHGRQRQGGASSSARSRPTRHRWLLPIRSRWT